MRVGDRWDTWIDRLQRYEPPPQPYTVRLTSTPLPGGPQSAVRRMTSLGDLLPVPSFHDPSRLMLWLYCGYGWRMKAIARLLGKPEKYLWMHLVQWRDAHQIQLGTEQLRAKPRRGYSEELRAEVTAWRQHRRELWAKRARQDAKNEAARARNAYFEERPERKELRNSCVWRWSQQGLSGQEIAQRLGVTKSRVYQLLDRERMLRSHRAAYPDDGVLPLLSAAEARCLAVTVGAMLGLMEARD